MITAEQFSLYRRLVIRGYLVDNRLEDARRAMLRYQQDYGNAGSEWRGLQARVLLLTGRVGDAERLLAGEQNPGPETHALKLLAQLRAQRRPPESQSYQDGVTDEFIKPIIHVDQSGAPLVKIQNGDLILFFNFRTDRPRQLVTVLSQQDIPEHGMHTLDLDVVTMTSYNHTYNGVRVLFEQDDLTQTLGEVLAEAGKTQLRIAETEKYPHVTYFFNGGREIPFPGEERRMIPSPKVATYDLKPEMSALEITDAAISFMAEHMPDFVCLNYANPDMVGHTGVFSAGIRAVETVDTCLGRLLEAGLVRGYGAIIIADHGNADMMINPDGSPNTAHTTNPVPVIYVSNLHSGVIRSGVLADIAPTILALLGVEKPGIMTGRDLLDTR
jgi:2,3-bisphosphoglycerate-independent phosphoglycerate mutase